MDPLTLLRDYTIRGELERISHTADAIIFPPDLSFPSTTPTPFRSKNGSFYPLNALLFFLLHRHLKHTDYLQAARQHRLPTVTLPDRKPLLDFLQNPNLNANPIPIQIPPQIGEELGDYNNSNQVVEEQEQEQELTPADLIAKIRAVERPLKPRAALLEAKNRDFYQVLLQSTKREEERHRLEAQQRKDGLVAKTRIIGADAVVASEANKAVPRAKFSLKGTKIGEGVPIILVPSASQTLITIYNVKEFLEDGVFVPSDVKAKGMKGPKPECVTVQKKLSRDRLVAAYEVRDKPSGFKADDWDRVVGVFVLGKEWQFKDWPFKDHVEIFNRIIGFFVRFEDDSLESAKTVKQWNVKIISISKNKRHQDRAAALEVWDRLEEFMRSRSH